MLTHRTTSRLRTLIMLGVIAVAAPEPIGSSHASDDHISDAVTTDVRNAGLNFFIQGSPTGELTPGTWLGVDLAMTNLNTVDLLVQQLSVSVRSVDAPHADADHPCSTGDFTVRELTTVAKPFVLPANSRRTLSSLGLPAVSWPAIGMVARPVNQDGCQSATIGLAYEGSATPMPQ